MSKNKVPDHLLSRSEIQEKEILAGLSKEKAIERVQHKTRPIAILCVVLMFSLYFLVIAGAIIMGQQDNKYDDAIIARTELLGEYICEQNDQGYIDYIKSADTIMILCEEDHIAFRLDGGTK